MPLLLFQLVAGCSEPATHGSESPPKIEQSSSQHTAPSNIPEAAATHASSVLPDINSHKSSTAALMSELTRLNEKLADRKSAAEKHPDKTSTDSLSKVEAMGSFSPLDEMSVSQTIKKFAQKHKSSLDLAPLRSYEQPITKSDMGFIVDEENIRCLKTLIIVNLAITDQVLEPLSKLRLKKIDAGRNQIKDLRALEGMDSLEELLTNDNPLNRAGFKRITTMKNIRYLNVSGTPLTDADLPQFLNLRSLHDFVLLNTGVSYAALKKLKSRLPDGCKIFSGLQRDSDSRFIGVFLGDLARGNFADTERAIEARIDRWQKQSPPDIVSIGICYGILGRCFEGQRRALEADAAFKKAVDIHFGGDPTSVDIWNQNDGCYYYLQKLERARNWDAAIQIRENSEKFAAAQAATPAALANNWQLARALNYSDLADDYSKANRLTDAARVYELAAKALQALGPSSFFIAICDFVHEGDALTAQHNLSGARTCFLKARALSPFVVKYVKPKDMKFINEVLSKKLDQIENRLIESR